MCKCNKMSFSEYQAKAKETAIYNQKYKIVYPTLGLTGEAGEVADKIKKVLRDNDGIFSEEKVCEIKKELGDVFWYLAAICNDLNIDMNEVAQMNLDKLFSRKDRGKLQGNGDNR